MERNNSRSGKWLNGFAYGVAWSPDGNTIATAIDNQAGVHGDETLVEVPVQGGAVRSLTQKHLYGIYDLVWVLDRRGLIVNASEKELGRSQIGYLSYREGKFRRITNDLNDYFGVSLSADSRALVTVQQESSSDIWVVALREPDTAKPITSGGQTERATWTPDGRIVFSKSQNFWVTGADGRNPRQLTVESKAPDFPRVSPDGRYVVFFLDNHIWRMDADGSNPKPLTNSPLDFLGSDLSPDGRWVVYTKDGAEKGIWKVSIEGGDPVRLSNAETFFPVVSLDGRWIAYSYYDEKVTPKDGVAIMPFDGGLPTKRLDIPQVLWVRWDASGRSLLYVKSEAGIDNIWRQPIAGGPPTQITHFVSDSIFSFDVSRDGKSLLMQRGQTKGDVVLIRDLR